MHGETVKLTVTDHLMWQCRCCCAGSLVGSKTVPSS